MDTPPSCPGRPTVAPARRAVAREGRERCLRRPLQELSSLVAPAEWLGACTGVAVKKPREPLALGRSVAASVAPAFDGEAETPKLGLVWLAAVEVRVGERSEVRVLESVCSADYRLRVVLATVDDEHVLSRRPEAVLSRKASRPSSRTLQLPQEEVRGRVS